MDKWLDSLSPVQGFAPSDGLIDEQFEAMATRHSETKPPPAQVLPLEIPRGPPRKWDRGAMIKRVRVGMMIELSTIPLYLYAMYSVKPTNQVGIQVRATLRAVLQQEMLHLALAGNLLSALGGSLDLYDPRVVPQYPGCILLGRIPMNLGALTTETLGCFMEIESASDAYSSSRSNDRTILASQYSSIGGLYEDLITGVRGLPDEIFANNPDKQFGNNFFGDQLFAITDQATALKALRTIIEQGEGNLRVDDSHYDVFSKLYTEAVSWEVYHVPDNPKTASYKSAAPYIYKISLAFDAAYCYLLQTIQRVWRTSENQVRLVLFRNIHSIMSNVLTPLAEILVHQGWGDKPEGVAAPCFNYYALTGAWQTLVPSAVPLAPKELHEELIKRMMEAVQEPTYRPEERSTLERIKCYIDENLQPSK